MSWRRRLLGTSALIGASVLCLRPVLNMGIERRLSEQLRLPVSVNDSQLAMSQNSLQLFRFQIDDEICPLSIDELSLRLDGNALLYRDCVVESFVGNGLRWHLPKPLEKQYATSTSIVTAQGNSAVKDIQVAFNQALRSIKDLESLSLDRSREIDLKLKALQTKIDELVYQSPAPNPLRSSQAMEKLRSDLIAIQSLLASDRVESSKMDSATNRSFDQLNAALELANKNTPNATTTSDEITKLIRENAIALATERVRPYAMAAEAGYLRFLRQFSPNGSTESSGQESSVMLRAGRELVTDKIPEREFALKRGRVTGQSTVGDMNLPTEIQISNVRLKRRDSNILQISWKAPNPATPETTCKIGPSIGTDNTVSHLLNLIQKEDDFEVTLQVNYDPTRRGMSLSFPLCDILDEQIGVDPELIVVFKGICEKQEIEMIAHSQCPVDLPAISESTKWVVEDEINSKIRSAVDEAMKQCLSARQDAWLRQSKTEYTASKQRLESRQLAIEEERNFRYSTWTDTLKTMENKLNSVDRASRNAQSRDSSLVR